MPSPSQHPIPTPPNPGHPYAGARRTLWLLAALATGCADGDAASMFAPGGTCEVDVGATCTCEDGATGEWTCDAANLGVCECEPAATDDPDAGDSEDTEDTDGADADSDADTDADDDASDETDIGEEDDGTVPPCTAADGVIDPACTDPTAPVCVAGACVACHAAPASSDPCGAVDGLPACAPSGACVECTPDAAYLCPSTTPYCDAAALSCVGCTEHDQCFGASCQIVGPDAGSCLQGLSLRVEPSSATCSDAPGSGTLAQPFCTVEGAMTELAGGDGTLSLAGPTVQLSATVTLVVGQRVTLRSTATETTLISAPDKRHFYVNEDAALFLEGLALVQPTQSAVAMIICADGAVSLRRSRLLHSTQQGIIAARCEVEGRDVQIQHSFMSGISLIGGELRLERSIVRGNDGPGIDALAWPSKLSLHDVVISRNEGGGLLLANAALRMTNTIFLGNGAAPGGAPVELTDTTLEHVAYVTFVDNKAGSGGAFDTMACSLGSSGVIRNSIVLGHSPASVDKTTCAHVDFDRSVVDFSPASGDNLTVTGLDPAWFVHLDGGDAHLSANAPEGWATIATPSVGTPVDPTLDIDGDPRPAMGWPGADERVAP